MPAYERVIRTLLAWNVRVDEAFFMGGVAKTKVLEAFKPHIFFDDQDVHCASRVEGRTYSASLVPMQFAACEERLKQEDQTRHVYLPRFLSAITPCPEIAFAKAQAKRCTRPCCRLQGQIREGIV
ncbi:MAG: 5'-nucleotidase [Tepidisphaeraceae bacterium]